MKLLEKATGNIRAPYMYCGGKFHGDYVSVNVRTKTARSCSLTVEEMVWVIWLATFDSAEVVP